MPHAVNMADPGLQAVILCGPGNSFSTFMGNPDENPKALLPIANRPMVWYPIDFCLRMGITDITLVCPPSSKPAMAAALKTNPILTSLESKIELLAPHDLDQNTGTADIFRLPELQALIENDFIVLPCDLVCELNGTHLLQAWMVEALNLNDVLDKKVSSVKSFRHSGGLSVWYETKTATAVKGEETDFLAVVPHIQRTSSTAESSIIPYLHRLALTMPTDSLNDHVEERSGLSLRHSLLTSNPRVRIRTSHRDAHIYVFPQWVMEYIKENPTLETLSEDIIGWWAKAGWQAGVAEKLQIPEIVSGIRKRRKAQQAKNQQKHLEGSPSVEPEDDVDDLDDEDGSPSNLVFSKPKDELDTPPVLAYLHPSAEKDAKMIRRVDSSALLLSVSLQLAKLPSIEEAGSPEAASPFAHPRKVAYPEGVKQRTTITRQDSLVGENVTVEEKVAIKETVVGPGCQIGEGSKLTQCLLMEGVVVGKNCKLTRCILGKRCVIGDGASLTNVQVQENLMVEARTEEKDTELTKGIDEDGGLDDFDDDMAE